MANNKVNSQSREVRSACDGYFGMQNSHFSDYQGNPSENVLTKFCKDTVNIGVEL